MSETFKDKHPFDMRVIEASNIRGKYPDRVPVVIEKSITSDIVAIDKNKYLVPCELTLGQFMYIIRKRMKLPPEQAVFVFIKNHIPTQSALLSALYDEFADEDGFLYMIYAGENTFGARTLSKLEHPDVVRGKPLD